MFQNTSSRIACVVLSSLFIMMHVAQSEAAAADQPVSHSFLGVGKANKASIVEEDGTVSWKVDLPCSDGWVLDSGNVLLAVYPCSDYPKGAVVEVDRNSRETLFAWHGRQKEISTAQPLPNDQFLVAELGPEPQAVVINRAGGVESTMPLACQKNNAHMQTRMLRQLDNGRYIAPHLLDFAVKEYDPQSGKVLKSFATDDRGRDKRDWPFTAIRLTNGNTVVGCTNGNRIIELEADGSIVWSVTNDDIGENLFDDACGVQRLPNGNTAVCSYHASGDSVKLFEVTRDKKVVWRYSGMKAGFHHAQILTTNGKPLSDNTMR